MCVWKELIRRRFDLPRRPAGSSGVDEGVMEEEADGDEASDTLRLVLNARCVWKPACCWPKWRCWCCCWCWCKKKFSFNIFWLLLLMVAVVARAEATCAPNDIINNFKSNWKYTQQINSILKYFKSKSLYLILPTRSLSLPCHPQQSQGNTKLCFV